jgi:DTW domain-containing protein YfiP
MSDNAVLRLRQQRLAVSTRPFHARGSRVIRCQSCLLPQKNCLCGSWQVQQARSSFCLVMYDTEPLKPSNTGRLIADILPDTQAFLWSRTQVDPLLQQAIADPQRQAYVVFPASYAQETRPVVTEVAPNSKPPLFIMLDGTWCEARKMFRKSPYLDHLPVFSLNMHTTSQYKLREKQQEDRYCTVEVASALLEKAGDNLAADTMNRHFYNFREKYLAGKTVAPDSELTANP